jgi:hypothetical protein
VGGFISLFEEICESAVTRSPTDISEPKWLAKGFILAKARSYSLFSVGFHVAILVDLSLSLSLSVGGFIFLFQGSL